MPLIRHAARQRDTTAKLLKTNVRRQASVGRVQTRNALAYQFETARAVSAEKTRPQYTTNEMTLEELEREYVALRQQGEAVRSYL